MPSKLAKGKEVDDYVMINDPGVRKILHKLVYGTRGKKAACTYSIEATEAKRLQDWIDQKQKCLKDYIPTVAKDVDGKQQTFLDKKALGIVEVSVGVDMYTWCVEVFVQFECGMFVAEAPF
jgi:hypothetical protein